MFELVCRCVAITLFKVVDTV